MRTRGGRDRDGYCCDDCRATARLRQARETAIRQVPLDVLPDGAARAALLALVRADCKVAAIRTRSGGGWAVWLGTVAWRRIGGAPGRDGATISVPLWLWRRHWRELVEMLGVAGVVAGVLGELELTKGQEG